MNNIYYRIGQWPIGYAIERALMIALALCIFGLFAGCTTTPTKEPEQPLTVHDANAARAMALQKIGESGDPETKRLAIFALATMGQGGQAPQPQVVVQSPRSVGEFAVGFVDRLLVGAERFAVPLLTYRGQVSANQTNERIAGINAGVSMNANNNFFNLGQAGINGTRDAGVAGVNALGAVASIPPGPTTNVSGNTGPVLIGGGNLNNGSLNPVNPAPVVCTVGTTTTPGTCSR